MCTKRSLGTGLSRFWIAVFAAFGVFTWQGDLSQAAPPTTRLAKKPVTPIESPISNADRARRVARIFDGKATPTTNDLFLMQERIQRITSKVVKATVGVRVGSAHGSGVIVTKQGHILTAAHVAVEPGVPAVVILSDGQEFEATTLGMELGLDAGMVKLASAGPWPHLPLAESKRLQDGQWCLATGHPGGYRTGRQPVLRIGRILASNDEEVLTDCTLVGGDSGGPLLNMRGRVIGIHSRIGAPLHANLHVPASVFQTTWKQMERGETHGPYLGVHHDRGSIRARIEQVQPNSPAAEGGLRSGDIVLRFDRHKVDNFEELREFILLRRPGDTVKLTVARDGTEKRLKVVLGDWSDRDQR